MKKELKIRNNKGITLVALVVTIIVLIVLAAVSINMLFGQYGIVTRAQGSKELQEQAQLNEQAALIEASEEILRKTGPATAQIEMESINFGIKATVTCSNENFNKAKSKFVFNNSSESLGVDESLYTEGNLTDQITTIEKVKTAGTYYLHVLIVDFNDNKKEYISSGSVTVSSVQNYNYTGNEQEVSLLPGKYKLEVWGAQGGDNLSYTGSVKYEGGRGGYSTGILNLTEKTTLYVNAGGKGGYSTSYSVAGAGGYNGGGSTGTCGGSSSFTYGAGGGGGGASDIRIGSNSLYARVIVAGGGGGSFSGNCNNSGSSYVTNSSGHSYKGGYGGGTTAGGGGTWCCVGGNGGNQTGCTRVTYSCSNGTYAPAGTFGQGSSSVYSSYATGTGGGGGWYGGQAGGSGCGAATGGGGSGYVYTSSTASNYPSGCLLNSSYYLTSASTIAGNTSFPSVSGGNETGHAGNGYVRITYQN